MSANKVQTVPQKNGYVEESIHQPPTGPIALADLSTARRNIAFSVGP